MRDTLKAFDELESCLERNVNALTRRIEICNWKARKIMDDFGKKIKAVHRRTSRKFEKIKPKLSQINDKLDKLEPVDKTDKSSTAKLWS